MKISEWIVRLRRSPLAGNLKVLVPGFVRRACWNLTARQEEFQVMGSRMFIPPGARTRDLVLDRYEPEVSACIRQLLHPGMVFCDVGANLGVFTLLAARQVGLRGRVFAFEPVPANFAALRRNVEANHFDNVTCIPKAVAQNNGISKLFLSQYCGSHSLVGKPAASTGESLDVEVVRLDSVPGIEQIDLLKIDVEGAELEVLEGLGRLRPKIILEYNAERILHRGLDGSAFLERLKALGYENVTNIDCPDAGLEPVTNGKDTTVNLLASPARRAAYA
jgi:FkbM family methyltransferase